MIIDTICTRMECGYLKNILLFTKNILIGPFTIYILVISIKESMYFKFEITMFCIVKWRKILRVFCKLIVPSHALFTTVKMSRFEYIKITHISLFQM